jgi:hypothetical protein
MTDATRQPRRDEPLPVRVMGDVVVVVSERAEMEFMLDEVAARETARRLLEAADQIRAGNHS